MSVYPTGEVRVIAPKLMPVFVIDRFVADKKDWITNVRDKFARNPPRQVGQYTQMLHQRDRRQYIARKEEARQMLVTRVNYFLLEFGPILTHRPLAISIRDQHGRWGSCSGKGNITFNYKLVLLPPELRDYVVVHELCHLVELNHSRAFWELVGKILPEWKELRRALKN